MGADSGGGYGVDARTNVLRSLERDEDPDPVDLAMLLRQVGPAARRTTGDGRETDEREADEPSPDRGVRFEGRARSREAALRTTLDRWAADLRRRAFGSPEPPFEDVGEAVEAWIDPARERGILGWGGDRSEGLRGAIEDLRRRRREVEEAHGVRLRDPVPVSELLELPRGETSNVRRRLDVAGRIPVRDAGSPHYAVARSVRRMSEHGGYRRADLTAFVLTGAEPPIPAATLEVRGTADPVGGRARRHAVWRLNEPPTVEQTRAWLSDLREMWADRYAAERRALVDVVREVLPEEELEALESSDVVPATPETWQPVADAWNRGREEDVSWRAVREKYLTARERGEA